MTIIPVAQASRLWNTGFCQGLRLPKANLGQAPSPVLVILREPQVRPKNLVECFIISLT